MVPKSHKFDNVLVGPTQAMAWFISGVGRVQGSHQGFDANLGKSLCVHTIY